MATPATEATGSVIVLNGAPRSGKTSIARAIQRSFPGDWVALGVDSARAATPHDRQPGIGLRPGGERPDLEAFVAAAYSALFDSVAAHSRNGLHVVVDVGIHDGYSRPLGVLGDLALRLDGVRALLVGVRCPVDVVAERRATDTAGTYETTDASGAPTDAVLRWQEAVHDPGRYDLEVDTSTGTPEACADDIRTVLDDIGPSPDSDPIVLDDIGPSPEPDPAVLDDVRRELHDDLIKLERGMWRTETRGDRVWMDDHLAPGFTEFGRSGRSYTRDDTLAIPIGRIEAELTAITTRAVGADAVLVTYRSVVGHEQANRASVWRHTRGRWRMELHQGTPTT